MAKSKNTLEQNQALLKANKAEYKQLNAIKEVGDDAELSALVEKIDLLDKQNAALERNISTQKKQKKELDKSIESIKSSNKFLEDSEDILGSIADKVGKSNKLYQRTNKYIDDQKTGLKSIAEYTSTIGNVKIAKEAEKAADAYKTYQKTVASIADRTMLTGKQQEEATIQIARARAEYESSVSALANMGEEGKNIVTMLDGMANSTQDVFAAVIKTNKEFNQMDAILGSFSGIPAMGELNALLKTNIKDTFAFKAAVFALGAALGKAAFDYFGAPIKAAMQADKEIQQNRIDGIAEVAKIRKDAESIPAQIGQERLEKEIEANEQIRNLTHEAQYAAQKAAISFSASMQTGAAQFQRAAKTALFGKGIGSVGYGAAQMQLAGIGADKVASSMEAAAAATGKMPSAKVGADMAIMADRTGQSVDSIASINEMFQRVDGATESTAMNLSEGLRAMATQANIGLGGLMKEMADASKDMLSYQIKSGPALAKQVAYAQTLGLSFGDIAKAGKSMVMNYKDSIKNEMQLSAMLGKNVDLSEVRAKFASGDTEGALKSLQAQGLDPADMDMFAQEQLSAALGGMDLNSLQKVATKDGGKVGGLKEGDAKAGNQSFLSTTQAAEATLNSQQASISAQTAIVDAELSKKIADAYLADPGYAKYKQSQADAAAAAAELATKMTEAYKGTDEYRKSLSDSAKLDLVSGLKENLMSAGAAILGGVGSTLISNLGTGIIDKFTGKGGGGADIPTADSGPSIISSVADSVIPGAGGVVDAVAGGGGVAGAATAAASAGAEALIPGGGAVVDSIAGQVEAIKGPVEESLTMGEQLKDLGKGIAAFGQGAGKGITAFLKGMAMGVKAFANPQVALGLGVITLAFIGLGYALELAAPAFKEIAPVLIKVADVVGNVLMKALEQAGPIITSIFNGIGTVISSIGTSIATVITSIATSIAMFAGLSAGNLLAVAGGITALSVAVGLFGVGSVLGAVGSFFGGSVFDDLKDISSYANPIQITADAVQSLANAFASLSGIDTSALKQIPWGDMEDFASEGGKFVLANSGGGSFALSKDTTKNIERMATNTDAMVKLNNTMAKILKEGFFGGETFTSKLYLDGKEVNQSMKRYKDNSRGGDPDPKK